MLIIRFQCLPIHFSIKLHVIAELVGFKDSISLLFLLTGLCSLLSPQNPPKATPESAEERKQENGMESSSAVFTGFVKHDDGFAQK